MTDDKRQEEKQKPVSSVLLMTFFGLLHFITMPAFVGFVYWEMPKYWPGDWSEFRRFALLFTIIVPGIINFFVQCKDKTK